VSRQLAAAQTIGSVEQGGRTVSLGDLLGPEFEANPRELFGPDNYHPSAEGYATAAMAVLPTLCAVLGLWPETDWLDGARREDMLPVAEAASQAAREAGTEVTGARAPWALLKHRRRRRLPTATEPQPHPETETETETATETATEPMGSPGPHEEPHEEPREELRPEPHKEPRPEPSGESHGEPHGESRNLPAN
jgi:hypothetical protein